MKIVENVSINCKIEIGLEVGFAGFAIYQVQLVCRATIRDRFTYRGRVVGVARQTAVSELRARAYGSLHCKEARYL